MKTKFKVPVSKPNPDFKGFMKGVSTAKKASKVYPFEHFFDEEIKKVLVEDYFRGSFVPAPHGLLMGNDLKELLKIFNSIDFKNQAEDYYKQSINLFYRLGYDFAVFNDFIFSYWGLLNNQMSLAKDTALLSRGDRSWAQEGYGRIKSWKDFYDYPWKEVEHVINMSEHLLSHLSKYLPDGMKIGVMAVMFENALEFLLGFNGFFLGVYDHPDLVKAVLEKLGESVLKYYNMVSQMDCVGFIIHGDDLGYKSSTMMSVEYLEANIFPWFKKFSLVAHKYGKPFWLHSCGKKDAIMETLINDIKIDGIHSFQDNFYSITDYKQKYGDRITLLGGVDMDKLIRLEENELRKYLRNILEVCMKNGRYAFGTGNTVCNYLPLERYMIMREEEFNWNL